MDKNKIINKFASIGVGIGITAGGVAVYEAAIGGLTKNNSPLQKIIHDEIPYSGNIDSLDKTAYVVGKSISDPRTLDALSSSKNFYAKLGVASNKKTPSTSLDSVFINLNKGKLTDTQKEKVLSKLASNPNISSELINVLIDTKLPSVASNLRRNIDVYFNAEQFKSLEKIWLRQIKQGHKEATAMNIKNIENSFIPDIFIEANSGGEVKPLDGSENKAHYPSLFVKVSEKNQKKLSDALEHGDISIKGVSFDNYEDESIFEPKDFYPVLKKGLAFPLDNVTAHNKKGQLAKESGAYLSVHDPDIFVVVSVTNKNLLTDLIESGDISIKNVDLQDCANKELFNIEDYSPILKEGLSFRIEDVIIYSDAGQSGIDVSVRTKDKQDTRDISSSRSSEIHAEQKATPQKPMKMKA